MLNKKPLTASKSKQKKIVDAVTKIDKKKKGIPLIPAIIPNKSQNSFDMDLYV